MVAFFIILAVLMVLVVAIGSGWGRAPRRYGREAVVDPEADVAVDRGPDVIEEEVYEDPAPRPVRRTRRVVRRRRY
ncbi:MAG: hypothetical protein M3N68_01560 [Actinomycetota bacterium]|nr:hypothetical protein [Actinomycetota bacterium]